MIRALFALALFLAAAIAPVLSWAQAYGYGVLDVGAAAPMPSSPGGLAFLQYDFLNQDQNWSGNKSRSDDANLNKEIRADIFTGGVQYLFNRQWGYTLEVPVVKRHAVTTDTNGVIGSLDNGAVGDIRASGVYSGFSPDMSSGLTFGLKVPTGPFKTPNFNRDTQIGTGSTDLLLGAYHHGRVLENNEWGWFSNGQWDEPMIDAGGYRPGAEIDAALGASYEGWNPGGFKLAPLAQVLGSARWRDIGANADPADSGCRRVLLSPGFEVSKGAARLYGTVEFPVYQFVNGSQLVASELYKLNVGWSF
jgi:hypothetical protein